MRVFPAIALLLVATSASAADDAARAGALDAVLTHDATTARRWYFAWAAGFAAAYAGGVVVAWKTNDVGLRADARVGAFMSGLGFVTTIAAPPPSLFFDRTRDVAKLEDRLRAEADYEALAHSWLAHALGYAANAAAGAYLWLHYDRPLQGVLQLAIGATVSTLRIVTAPRAAMDFTPDDATKLQCAPWWTPGGAGVALLRVW